MFFTLILIAEDTLTQNQPNTLSREQDNLSHLKAFMERACHFVIDPLGVVQIFTDPYQHV